MRPRFSFAELNFCNTMLHLFRTHAHIPDLFVFNGSNVNFVRFDFFFDEVGLLDIIFPLMYVFLYYVYSIMYIRHSLFRFFFFSFFFALRNIFVSFILFLRVWLISGIEVLLVMLFKYESIL